MQESQLRVIRTAHDDRSVPFPATSVTGNTQQGIVDGIQVIMESAFSGRIAATRLRFGGRGGTDGANCGRAMFLGSEWGVDRGTMFGLC